MLRNAFELISDVLSIPSKLGWVVILAAGGMLVTGFARAETDLGECWGDECEVWEDELHINAMADINTVEDLVRMSIPVDDSIECEGIACGLGQEQFMVYEKPADQVLTLHWVTGATVLASLRLEAPTLEEEDLFVAREMALVYPEMIPRGTAVVGEVYGEMADAGFLDPVTSLAEVIEAGALADTMLRYVVRLIEFDSANVHVAVAETDEAMPAAEALVVVE